MKKLKLKKLEFSSQEILTREQLKNVIGGDDYGYGGGVSDGMTNSVKYLGTVTSTSYFTSMLAPTDADSGSDQDVIGVDHTWDS